MNYKKLINQLIVEQLKEMARIPILYQLSTTDEAEIESKMPANLKSSSTAKNIIDFYLGNGNKPSATPEIVKFYGYPAQQAVNTQMQLLRAAGILVGGGLAFPKQVKQSSGLGQGRPITNIGDRDDEGKVKYIIAKLKAGGEPHEEYKKWFLDAYGQERYTELTELINQYKATNDKETSRNIKHKISDLLKNLGFVVKQLGRKPKYTNPTRNPNEETGFDDVTYDNEDNEDELYEKHGDPRRPSPNKPRELPGIAEPPSRTKEPTPKRRTLNPPKEAPATKPKAEGKVKWGKKEAEKNNKTAVHPSQLVKTGSYKGRPPIKKVNETEQNILGKIVDRYKKNNGNVN